MTEFDLLRKQNNELRELAVNQMVSGNVQNVEAYRELVGVVRGLGGANSDITDLEKRLEQNDDE